MVVRIEKINNISFRNTETVTKPIYSDSDEIKITELKKTTPDYNVKIPQKYSKLGITELENGLKLHSYKLANGHKVTIIPMESSPTIVKNYVNVGSMNETDDIKGISHFLEHMAFNGTNGTEGYLKLNRGDSFRKVDEMGGWTNAGTSYAFTEYINSTPQLNDNDLENQIRIIASMTEDLALSSDMVEKEKFPVCSEIDMILDSPETIAIDQTVRSLFNIRSSADELVGGSVDHIQNLTREKVLEYYNKYYTPDNMHLVITGNVNPDATMQIVAKNFHSQKIPQGKRFDEKLTPIKTNVRKDFITDKASSTSIVIGFAGPPKNNIKADIISEILEKYIDSTAVGLSEELNKRSANYYSGCEKISTNPNNPTFIYYQVECSDNNTEEILKMMFDKLSNLKAPDENTLNNIKTSMKMEFDDMLEQSMNVNDLTGRSAFYGNIEYLTDYKNILNDITIEDITDYINKYLDMSKTAISVVHPNVDENVINENYKNAQKLSFKGTQKKPIDMSKISEATLDNNYKIAFSESTNNNIPFVLDLYFDLPEGTNPAAIYVLNSIYTKGTKNVSETEFLRYQEKNNLSVNVNLKNNRLTLGGYSSADNFEKATAAGYELLNNPRINEQEVSDAINRIKEQLLRYDNSSSDLYEDYESVNNPYSNSKDEILNNLDSVTVKDIQNLHDYIMNNSKGIITINIPEKAKDIKTRAIRDFSEFNQVKPYKHEPKQIYKAENKPVVLTEARNVSQADISQVYKFETNGSIKEKLTAELMNAILSNSDTIGLFNSLREHDHLAYRVNSSLNIKDNLGEVSLRILTSTDNKDTGTESYDNVQKSINGFHRQINKLVNSEYKDSDLETAKRRLKASLLNKELAISKLAAINRGLSLDKGLDYENQIFDMIDSITREDIDAFSKKVFSANPVYAIVASQDTLDYNKEFLDEIAN